MDALQRTPSLLPLPLPHALLPSLLLLATWLLPLATPFASTSFASSRLGGLEAWRHEVELEAGGAFVVQWTPRHDTIEFRVTARTTGYIGFGLSHSPRMDGADIVVGWVHSGKAYLQDRHGRGNREPLVDAQRDWMLVGGYENDTHTVLIMSRPYNTCDKQDHVISNDTIRLLWAYHPDDPVDPESPRPRLHYHGVHRRGVRSIFLLGRGHSAIPHSPYARPYPGGGFQRGFPGASGGYSSGGSGYPGGAGYPEATYGSHHRGHRRRYHHPPQTESWVLTNPEVEVEEGKDTVYWCKVFKRPPLDQKNHVIRYEPVFTPGNEEYLHHLIVYECADYSDNPEVAEQLNLAYEELSKSPGHECYQTNMSKLLYSCNHVVVAWALGSEGLTLPQEAGYPLTPNGPKFYMMESHYDNPEGHAFRDRSGIRMIYTPELRAYDAGVLSVGLDPSWKHLIPPRQRTVLSEGHCVGECTHAALPNTGINVFAVILHTHLLGRKVRVRHLRDGRELEPLAQDNNYDFNYQESRALHTPRTVLPGDHLIGECTYNSKERSTITLGGFKTRDEMCLSFLFYWPRVDMSFCHSKPSLNTVLHSLGIQELSHDSDPITIRRPIELAGKSLEWRLLNYDWKHQFEYFQHATHTGSINPMCWKRGESLLPELEKLDYDYPNITEPWLPENVCRQLRRMSRRRKNKAVTSRRRNHPTPTEDTAEDFEEEEEMGQEGEEEMEGEEEEEEVMFDDQTNSRHIETVDVDPYHHRDFHMPVVEERIENDNYDSYDGFGDISPTADRELTEELQEMDRELGKELANTDHFQEERNSVGQHPSSHAATTRPAGATIGVVVVAAVVWSCLQRRFDGHG